MTPSERKKHRSAEQLYADALFHCSRAPRKSWLGRFTPLTAIQSAWIKSLLSAWGESYGGKTSEQIRIEGQGQEFWDHMRMTEWTEDKARQITEVMQDLRGQGLSGPALLFSASRMLFPGALADYIDTACERENAEFMEKAILQAFSIHDPVFIIGKRYYTRRQSIAKLARKLQELAPWLTDDKARERVKWCLQIFRAKVFLSVRQNMKMN